MCILLQFKNKTRILWEMNNQRQRTVSNQKLLDVVFLQLVVVAKEMWQEVTGFDIWESSGKGVHTWDVPTADQQLSWDQKEGKQEAKPSARTCSCGSPPVTTSSQLCFLISSCDMSHSYLRLYAAKCNPWYIHFKFCVPGSTCQSSVEQSLHKYLGDTNGLL